MLRPYQQDALDMLDNWMRVNDGHPCLVMPTGSGKSHVIAIFCKNSLQVWPSTRILMLTHVKELIAQNAEKLLRHWPGAPLGIYSSALGKRQLGEPIIFAGVQSIARKINLLGHIDVVLIDEAHRVSHKAIGEYRFIIDDLTKVNPALRVIGLTATPYRLSHGLITDKPGLFDGLIEPTSIEELIKMKYLAPLRSKLTIERFDLSGVHLRGGEYIERELQTAVDKNDKNSAVVGEIIARAENRKAWLIFCTGVSHAKHIADELNTRGIPTGCITGAADKKSERDANIQMFKRGQLRALTNYDVLTTGFDYPDIDLIAMLRPTLSPGLYVQCAGRGMRLKTQTDHCLFLDFAGVIEKHGPITDVKPPKKPGEKKGDTPVKVCDKCNELVHLSCKVCPDCGFVFPIVTTEKTFELSTDIDIMGADQATREQTTMHVDSWRWREQISKSSGLPMIAVTYYEGPHGRAITEYLTVWHKGFAGKKALEVVNRILMSSTSEKYWLEKLLPVNEIDESLMMMAEYSNPPSIITYRLEGKYPRIIERIWSDKETSEETPTGNQREETASI